MIYVDLTSPGLRPEAVVSFVLAHRDPRPAENILFNVTREVFEDYVKDLPREVLVSQEEADAINEFLGTSSRPESYSLDGVSDCSNCGRTLNFYDLFVSGRKRHGSALMKRTLAGDEFKIQVAGAEARQEVDCTSCGTLNILDLQGGGAYRHYTGTHYTYA